MRSGLRERHWRSGAFRFDIPEGWHFVPGTPTLKFYDREPPDDNILFEATLFRLPGAIDWTDLLLRELFEEATKDAQDEVIWRSDKVQTERKGLELIWHETRFIDPGEHREGRSHTAVARRGICSCLDAFLLAGGRRALVAGLGRASALTADGPAPAAHRPPRPELSVV
jgi:hypothetical protein